jgi:hypothetical protein
LPHQQQLAADRVEDLEQLRPQQSLWRNRRPAHAGIEPVKFARHVTQDAVDQRADRTDRMVGRHTLLGGHVTKHRLGLTIISSHATW